jgi:hypothetical protein
VQLLERSDVPHELIEVVEYESEAAYEADQRRVEEDPQMMALLRLWRELLEHPPVVEAYTDVTDELLPRKSI